MPLETCAPHRSPCADSLAVRSAYLWYRLKGRRAWRRAYPAQVTTPGLMRPVTQRRTFVT